MFAEKKPGRFIHTPNIERTRFVMGIPTPERRHHWRVNDAVDIRFLFCRKARVKIVRYLFGIHDPDVPPEIAVDRVPKSFRSELAAEMNIGNLTLGMYTGIGTARSDDTYVCICQHSDHPFQFALNCP